MKINYNTDHCKGCGVWEQLMARKGPEKLPAWKPLYGFNGEEQ